jgi:hypothetical protein
MKWIIVPILMILLLVQSFSKWLVVMDFTIHRDFISKNLCENRNRPRLQCNGRCQLAKKLAEEEKQNSSQNPGSGKIKAIDLLYDEQVSIPDLFSGSKRNRNLFSGLIQSGGILYSASIFHPPA